MKAGIKSLNGIGGGGGASTVVYNMAEIKYAPIVPILAFNGIIRRTDLVDATEFPDFIAFSGAVNPKDYMDAGLELPPGVGIGQNLSTGAYVFLYNKSDLSYIQTEIISYSTATITINVESSLQDQYNEQMPPAILTLYYVIGYF